MSFPLTKDGWRELLAASAIPGVGGGLALWAAIDLSAWFWALAIPLLALWLFCMAFFRDPKRTIPGGSGLLVSPADGRVTEVSRLAEYQGIDGPALKISIFLSIFNVHVNRAACGGRVVRTDYRAGEFLDARHPESGIRNESNTIVVDPDGDLPRPVIIRQVAGMVARRIVCNVKPQDILCRGQRFGMIKFGSRTELIVPAAAGLETAVRVGDRVKGGSTVLIRSECPARGGSVTENRRQLDRLAATPSA